MHSLVLSPPLFGFIVGTRVVLGVGIGLLAAARLPEPRRRAVGLTLLAVGAASTLPAAVSVLRRSHAAARPANDLSARRLPEQPLLTPLPE